MSQESVQIWADQIDLKYKTVSKSKHILGWLAYQPSEIPTITRV